MPVFPRLFDGSENSSEGEHSGKQSKNLKIILHCRPEAAKVVCFAKISPY